MIDRRPFLAAILAGLLLVGQPTWAQEPAATAYSKFLELYQAGQIQAALADLATLTPDDLRSGQNVVFTTFARAARGDTGDAAARLQVAALVHTEAAFTQFVNDSIDTERHLVLARRYIEKLPSPGGGNRFPQDWWLLVIALFQGHLELSQARDYSDRARQSIGESPELWLATGISEEMAWTFSHDNGAKYSFNGDLKDAAAAYRRALAGQPDLVEARVRLGRVLTLRGNIDESLRILGPIGAGDDAESRYLARLFEGDALERRGNFPEAERQYLAAFAALPRAQSARLALGHLRHLRGSRADAAATVRATAEDRAAADDTDPWFWYARGLLWRAPEYLQRLRAAVQR
jgi:tetratricopeptide (TPR) repeat protein